MVQREDLQFPLFPTQYKKQWALQRREKVKEMDYQEEIASRRYVPHSHQNFDLSWLVSFNLI